jgi:hypothetical protein
MNANRGMFGYEGEGFDYVNEDEVRKGQPHEGWNIGREDNADAPAEPVNDDDVPSGGAGS